MHNMQSFSLFTDEMIQKNNQKVPDDRLQHLKETALQLYNGTFSHVPFPEYLSFLCNALRDDFTTTEIETIQYFYLDLFSWKPNFLECLRMLCSRIMFRAESQYIEDILDSLSNHWWHKYGEISLVRNSNGVFLLFYSLVLLNTDFTTEGTRISKKNYVENTIKSLSDNKVPLEGASKLKGILGQYYDDLALRKLPLARQSSKRSSLLSLGSRKSSFFRSSDSWFSDKTPIFTDLTHSQQRSVGFANALAHNPACSMQLAPSPSLLSLSNEKDSRETQYVIEEEGDVALELRGPPWIKEGIVLHAKLDPVNGGSHSVASWWRDRKSRAAWKRVFAVASRGELNVYVFDQKKSGSLSNGGGNWVENATCFGSFNLCQCLAKVPSKSELSKIISQYNLPMKGCFQHFWLLILPNGSSPLVFSSSTEKNVSEFVDTCNLWAARVSGVCTSEFLSSSEFGWSGEFVSHLERGQDYLRSCIIERWVPINGALINSKLPMREQLAELKTYSDDLSKRMEDHSLSYERLRDVLALLELKRNEPDFSIKLRLVQANYSNRQRYLTNEIVRTTTYIEILERALQLRTDNITSPSTHS